MWCNTYINYHCQSGPACQTNLFEALILKHHTLYSPLARTWTLDTFTYDTSVTISSTYTQPAWNSYKYLWSKYSVLITGLVEYYKLKHFQIFYHKNISGIFQNTKWLSQNVVYLWQLKQQFHPFESSSGKMLRNVCPNSYTVGSQCNKVNLPKMFITDIPQLICMAEIFQIPKPLGSKIETAS